ncbi:MAG: hypothetical protein HYU75_06850 [Betaproteobacteria bacterium]|nr:hypothetical protein [Betaproteobacteria bacterium]
MFATLSALATRPGFAPLYSFALAGSAVSSTAQSVQQVAGIVVNSLERSQALFGDKAGAISQLWALANECSDPGWDGHEAVPLNRLAIWKAISFIRALPDGVPLPEFAPEPDGSVSLDWMPSRNRLFSISIGTTNRLAYAWLDGADKGHAVARFDEASIPPRILEGIKSIVNDRNAVIRSR